MKLFISYSSKDRELVSVLTSDLTALGHEVWFDDELTRTGGQKWWSNILNNLRACDVFIFALTPNSLDSDPCRREYNYAYALHKRVLPVMLESVEIAVLPAALQELQFVNYIERSRAEGFALAATLNNLPPAQPLPDPLPAEPETPLSPLARLSQRLDVPALNPSEQAEIVLELETLFAAPATRRGAETLLLRLRERDDLTNRAGEKIRSLLPDNRRQSGKTKVPEQAHPKQPPGSGRIIIGVALTLVVLLAGGFLLSRLQPQQVGLIVEATNPPGVTQNVSPTVAPSPVKASSGLKIGLVTDIGTVTDRSFNQSAWEGAQAGAKAIGGTADFIESASSDDYAHNIQQFVDKQYNVIVTVGFLLTDATAVAAKNNPKIKFILVDSSPASAIDNLTGLVFQEDQAGFLVGVLAANLSKSGTVAGVYGFQVPAVVRYKEGFEAGAKYAKPSIQVLSAYYPGGIDKAFTDPDWGASTAAQMIDQGADIEFAAAGTTGNGALSKVAKSTTKAKPLYCIGVDLDQWYTFPESHPCLISSAVKLIDSSLVTLLTQAAAGTLKGGTVMGEVGYAPFHDFASLVPDAVQAQLKQAATDLASGKITIPTSVPR